MFPSTPHFSFYSTCVLISLPPALSSLNTSTSFKSHSSHTLQTSLSFITITPDPVLTCTSIQNMCEGNLASVRGFRQGNVDMACLWVERTEYIPCFFPFFPSLFLSSQLSSSNLLQLSLSTLLCCSTLLSIYTHVHTVPFPSSPLSITTPETHETTRPRDGTPSL